MVLVVYQIILFLFFNALVLFILVIVRQNIGCCPLFSIAILKELSLIVVSICNYCSCVGNWIGCCSCS